MNTFRSVLRGIGRLWEHAHPYLHSLQGSLLRLTDTDKKWVIILLVLAALLRFPALDHPNGPVFDETFYANYTIHLLDEQPTFDIHPPFARMLFAEVAQLFEPFSMRSFPIPPLSDQLFLDFPYIPLRMTVALFGTLLPLFLYAAGRLLGYTPRWSGLIALLVIIDPAFIVYSRAILPDTILLCVEIAALCCALWSIRSKHRYGRIGGALLAALFLGMAMSIKWIALSMVAVVVLLYLVNRRWKTILATGVVIAGVYVSIFAFFVLSFPNGGASDPVLLTYDVPYVTESTFPAHPTFGSALRALPELHQVMWHANTDPETSSRLPEAPTPLTWPVAKVSLLGWWSADHDRSIVLQGNPLLWNLAFFLFLFEIGWIIARWRVIRTWPIDHTETILVLGYVGSYLPFFFIHRPMFLYHYFLALLFLFLLLPKVAPRAIDCLGTVTKDRLFALVFAWVVLVLVGVASLISFPVIYGF